MGRRNGLLVAAICLTLLAGPAAAASATVAIDAPGSTEAGSTVTLDMTLTNTGDNESYFLLNMSVPDRWDVVSHADDGGTWDSDETSWVWLSVGAGDNVTASLTLAVPSDADAGEVSATAVDADGILDTAVQSVAINSGDSDDDDDNNDDDGDDDDSDSDTNDGGSDDDDSGGSTVSYPAATPGPTETPVTVDGGESGGTVEPDTPVPPSMADQTPGDTGTTATAATDGRTGNLGVTIGIIGMVILGATSVGVLVYQSRY